MAGQPKAAGTLSSSCAGKMPHERLGSDNCTCCCDAVICIVVPLESALLFLLGWEKRMLESSFFVNGWGGVVLQVHPERLVQTLKEQTTPTQARLISGEALLPPGTLTAAPAAAGRNMRRRRSGFALGRGFRSGKLTYALWLWGHRALCPM